jgi:DNA helicase-2/ATP-dependent DNA helicase PcrA
VKKKAIDFVAALNPEQLVAAQHGAGPQLVLAGAGSGKTRVITYRIAWLVQELGVDPYQITAVTFTNKAAGEMRSRVEDLVQIYPLPAFVGTFHRFALRLLRTYGERLDLARDFTIFDVKDQRMLVKKALAAEGLEEGSFQPRAVLAAISSAKNKLLTPAQYEAMVNDFFRIRVAKVYRRYQKLMREAGGIDLDDMIMLSLKLLQDHDSLRERVLQRTLNLLVDEFQDTNHAQLSLIQELCDPAGNLTAVGDEDQGIYSWRGAELENILRFERFFPNAAIHKLERNYRSTQNILDASGAVVAHNRDRRGKSLWTEAGGGEKIRLYQSRDELDEARWLVRQLQRYEADYPLSEMAILVRTNAQTRTLEDELLRQKMPYTLVGGLRFYERAEIKDLIAYLRLLKNPRDNFSLSRILNRPPRGIGRGTQDSLLDLAAEHRMSMWEILLSEKLDGIPARGAKALLRFRDMAQGLIDEAAGLPLRPILANVLEATTYAAMYDKPDMESQSKLENIQEFLSAAQEFTENHAFRGEDDDLLTSFLDHASLTSDLDSLSNGQGVSVMTLHSAKGLEFAVAAVSGLEEGLLPHFNSSASEESFEEERRLLYVGMTRAERHLLLTSCDRRRIAGRYQDQRPSPFLAEIPSTLLEVEESPEHYRHDQAGNVNSFFHRSGRQASSGGNSSRRERVLESTREYHPEAAEGGLRKGLQVRHATLGKGVVLAIDGNGDDARLTVVFESVGRRKLIARYARLEPA